MTSPTARRLGGLCTQRLASDSAPGHNVPADAQRDRWWLGTTIASEIDQNNSRIASRIQGSVTVGLCVYLLRPSLVPCEYRPRRARNRTHSDAREPLALRVDSERALREVREALACPDALARLLLALLQNL